MAGFLRRFTYFPPIDVIAEIEGVVVVDLIPPGIFVGRQSGTVALIGEWPGGEFNSPTLVESAQTIASSFGGFSLSCVDPFSYTTPNFLNPFSNGNAFCWLKGKRFRRLILVRVDNRLAEGVHIQLTGTPTPLAQDITIPAGTRVRDAGSTDREFALAQSVTFAAGTDLTAVAFTAFDQTDLSAKYSTRTVSDVPVYSTKNTAENAVGDVDSVDSGDLFRAGIGAGTLFPSLVVDASTGALDGAAANAAVLTPLTLSTYETRYENALNATLPGNPNSDNIEIVACARQSDDIRVALLENARDASAVGTGRVALIRPPIGTLPAAAIGAVDPGVGVNRSDLVFYCYPHFEQRIADLAELDPEEVISGPNILLGGDAAMGTILSQLPPELNPGQSTKDFSTGGILSFIRALEPGLTGAGLPTSFTLTNYIAFKAAGVAALRRDAQISEWVFQSGVTSVDPDDYPSLAPINRRRMAFFVQDSLAAIAKNYTKKIRSSENVDSMVGEMADFLDGLLSETNPAQQRIAAYSIDATSGNTSELQGSGIFVVEIAVQMLDTMDSIVLVTRVGATVDVSVQE